MHNFVYRGNLMDFVILDPIRNNIPPEEIFASINIGYSPFRKGDPFIQFFLKVTSFSAKVGELKRLPSEKEYKDDLEELGRFLAASYGPTAVFAGYDLHAAACTEKLVSRLMENGFLRDPQTKLDAKPSDDPIDLNKFITLVGLCNTVIFDRFIADSTSVLEVQSQCGIVVRICDEGSVEIVLPESARCIELICLDSPSVWEKKASLSGDTFPTRRVECPNDLLTELIQSIESAEWQGGKSP